MRTGPIIVASLSAIALCGRGGARASGQVDLRQYAVYSGSQMRTPGEMLDALSKADVVFVGEQHDHKLGHLLEAEIFQGIHARNPAVTLALEMFERDTQPILDEYLSGIITENSFLQAARPWPAYKTDYRPLVEFCREKKLPVVAANAPRRYVNIVSRKGSGALKDLSRDAKRDLPRLPIHMELPKSYDEQLTKLFGGAHNTTGPGQPTAAAPPPGMPTPENMKQAQALWDATMADSILQARRANRDRTIVMFNGAMHSDSGYGIVDRLRKSDKNLKVMIVSIKPDGGYPALPSGKYDGVADYLILTPLEEKATAR